ncbi:PRECOCIOUS DISSOCIATION OF SISTERS 5 ISOFORM A [Salix koriyanagi]|uniref:PRECOCIOUS DISSOCIATION OF SISTERS 5 ISOFORM A n=1 Tax=Salix koriyanagi TaxID=2511006 RepID=A0A9Q0YRT2_9ROSI|nr:PRECOCIOUS DISSOCIATION OF SISTERS 5 ISOFORM A [Salix koriyanagi]
MDESPLQLVSEIGDHLGRRARPNKDFLVKSLRQAANALSQIEQPLETFQKTEAVKKLEAAINPLRKSILKHGLIKHTDKEVKLLVAICVSEVFRVLAPEPPFEDKYLRDIFILFLNMFKELSDTASPHFLRRVKVLETVARCKCCVIMLDIDCHDLVLEMFNIFFSSVREHHQRSLIDEILSIMKLVLNEEASQALSDVILLNLIKEGKAAPPAASQLAASVIQTCEEKLEPFVCGFLTSCFLDRDAVDSELKEFYHEILFKVFPVCSSYASWCHPQLDSRVTDRSEFKNRFSDKSAEVRLSALQCAKACYIANPSGNVSHEILTALEGRLLDFDDRVRTQAAVVACDLARTNLRFFPPELISKVAERLRDKKISVRKKALEKLMEVYREYCIMCSEGPMTASDHFEQIPCKVLMLSYDKDCKDFRPQNMELVIAEDLFPVFLPVEERTRHWIHLFSLFTSSHVKALISILSQKRRLQTEMQIYLAQRKKEKESSSEEMERRIKTSFVKMSASFPDPLKAEECFHKLNQMKDSKTFNALEQLLDDRTIKSAQQTRSHAVSASTDFIMVSWVNLVVLNSLHLQLDMFHTFSEHVQYILDHISSIGFEQHLKASAKLLLAIISVYPSFMRGLEQQFQLLLEENNSINDTLVEVLAKAGPHIKAKFSEFYPLLERICLKGTRFQSKHAVSAIAALFGSSDEFIFSKLCKELVDSLYSGLNTPTVLQSLGCIAQHSVSAFEAQNQEIRSYIFGRIFQAESSEDEPSADETSDCCDSCKLKIYALKALVKSFLPHRGSHGKLHINELLDTLSKLLQTGYAFDGITSCENDKPHIKLAAAKSVLQLSRRWDLHISPEIFRFTVLMAKEPCPLVKRLFLDKMHKLLKEHAIPSRYACAYALAASDHCKDLQDAALKNIEEFIKDYSRKAQIRQTSGVQGSSLMDYPAYIVVFLIHVLAHDAGFPPDGCQDEQVYAQFCSPLFWALQALDAVDAHQTPKLLILAEIGISIVNELNHVISSSLAPKQISLPSSLYRISVVKKCDKTSLKCLTKFSVDESFVKRVVHILKSQISGPATTTLSKRRRKVQEVTIQSSDVEHNTSNPASQKIASLSLTGTREKQKAAAKEIGLGYTRKRALSPIDSESMVLQNEHPATVMHRDDAKSITASNYPRAELKEPHNLRISYDSGDLLCLDSESHENMSDNSLLEKETLLTEVSNTFHPIHCSQRKTSGAFRDGAAEPTKCLASMENGRFSQRAISFPAKGKKGQKALLDISSASENVLSSSM